MRLSPQSQNAWAAPLALCLSAGCVGSLDSPSGPLAGDRVTGDRVAEDDGELGGSTAPLSCTARSVGPAPLQHLTRVEYVRTLRDLVGVEVPVSELPPDDKERGRVRPLVHRSLRALRFPKATAACSNTLVLWGNELGVGNSHTRDDVPFLLAGGPIRKGQFLKFDKRPHNDLLLSICHALGLERSTFGDTRFSTGAISEILL